MSDVETVVRLVYLAAAVCFVLGLHLMRSPVTARRGNALSAGGMAAAVLATVVLVADGAGPFDGVSPWAWLALGAGTAVGAGGGLVSARRVEMTAMPQLVSLFNAVGGGAAAVVAVVEWLHRHGGGTLGAGVSVPVALDVLVGSVTFAGSLLAAAKLQGWVSGAPITFTGSRAATVACTVLGLGAAAWLVAVPSTVALLLTVLAALAFGVLMVLPIGGADMPVVVSLLNAFTGIAVAMAGFVVGNDVMIIAGALVGASGAILTQLMAEAMNRSVVAVLVGGFGTGDSAQAGVASSAADVRRVDADDVAIQLAYARTVVIVPGYGLAAAQAQRECGELGALLTARGITVLYAVHPVAGRMPGHMNVLLAEADVPYAQLVEMEEANPELAGCDVALVVGANDVTNPAARRPGNPISGMPILDVDRARSVVVIKRSLGHGYAGLDNELYALPQTGMLFADAKDGLTRVLAAVRTTVA
ncbi:NAD(P)(+) transhydrogenase (Re/Si-specific) subunit beta [Cellulomonas sp. ATA003]|uniref:NAD(P)(+) transhydrogenase (Re/Si-specific) subunit beta n=1 Tax=Cellulomonas sp. ATA003 TaxID=3073064 RepID=UPI002872FA72|nr:NAD(P)(+) transhydrogenase (Re/Si-specific) subunit beta [Cellulomonas sp. ATA003]WNB87254.1 NAD(P)(+) transhydrogenase (Re/Si-specific) subunit beta [Cellulomonas sp. ATA003]